VCVCVCVCLESRQNRDKQTAYLSAKIDSKTHTRLIVRGPRFVLAVTYLRTLRYTEIPERVSPCVSVWVPVRNVPDASLFKVSERHGAYLHGHAYQTLLGQTTGTGVYWRLAWVGISCPVNTRPCTPTLTHHTHADTHTRTFINTRGMSYRWRVGTLLKSYE